MQGIRSRQSDGVSVGLKWIVQRAARIPSVFPDEHTTVPMFWVPCATDKIHDLYPIPVILGVSDRDLPGLSGIAILFKVDLLIKGESAFWMFVAGLRSRTLARIYGHLVCAVPVEILAPGFSVIEHCLDHIDDLFALLELENLFEVPWVLHLDLIGDRVRIVDEYAVLADIFRWVVTRVRDHNIERRVLHSFVMLALLVSVPIGPVIH